MRIFVLSVGTLLTFGLLVFAAHIAWQEIQTLRHLSQLDRWAEEVPEWQ